MLHVRPRAERATGANPGAVILRRDLSSANMAGSAAWGAVT
jgi:hypothetical protein